MKNTKLLLNTIRLYREKVYFTGIFVTLEVKIWTIQTWQVFTIWSMVWGSPREQIGDFVSPTCTWKLCMCHGLCGNGSTVTRNNEVGQSLAVVRWGPQLLRSWLLKLTVSPFSIVSSCLQETNPSRWDAAMKVAEMGEWKHQRGLPSPDGCLFYTASCLQLTTDRERKCAGDNRESSGVRRGCGTATAHSSWADLAKMPNSRLKSALINESWIARNSAAV